MLQLKAPLQVVGKTRLVRASKRGGYCTFPRRCPSRRNELTRRQSTFLLAARSDRAEVECRSVAEPYGEEASSAGKEREGGRKDPLPATEVSGDQKRRKPQELPEKPKTSFRGPAKGRRLSDEHRRKIAEAKKGKRFSDEHRRRISEGKKGKRFSDEHRRKLSLAKLGRKRDPDLMKMIGEKKTGFRHTLQARIKISKAKRGRKADPATKAKMSASQKARWEERLRDLQLKDIIVESKISKPKLKVDTEKAIIDLSSLRRELAAWLRIWYQENTEKPSLKEIENLNPLVYDKFIRYLDLMDAMREEDSE